MNNSSSSKYFHFSNSTPLETGNQSIRESSEEPNQTACTPTGPHNIEGYVAMSETATEAVSDAAVKPSSTVTGRGRDGRILLPPSKSQGFNDPRSELKIVRIDQVLIHEIHDPTRTGRLVKSLTSDGCQRHPVIVARTRGRQYIHLDGANRLTALRQLGCEYVAVQALDYSDDAAVTLDNWTHIVNIEAERFGNHASSWFDDHCDIRPLQFNQVSAALSSRAVAAAIIFSDGRAVGLFTDIGLGDRLSAIEALTSLYDGSPIREILPAVADTPIAMTQLLSYYPSANACIAFTPLTKENVVTLARNMDRRIPAGITRHVVTCGRLLHVNVSLELLKGDETAEVRTEQLAQFLKAATWRTYEPTYIREQY